MKQLLVLACAFFWTSSTYTQPSMEVTGSRGTSLANLIVTNTASGPFPAIQLNSSASATVGVSLYGTSGMGLNVGDILGVGFVPVYASAFTVSSDSRVKKEIRYLTETDYDHYLNDLRSISSATYRYNWEDEKSRPAAHLGFIAQTLPSSIQMDMDKDPSRQGETIIGYNLSDMAGLSVIVMKALDSKLIEQGELIQQLKARLDAMEKR